MRERMGSSGLAGLVVGLPAVLLAVCLTGCSADWWATPDQQGQRHFDRGDFGAAAERFQDPMRRGTALFRAGRFAESAAEFGRVPTADGHFNRGTALIMAGDYAAAVQSFDRSLALRSDCPAAARNREIARLRLERLSPEVEDTGGTGGKLGADEIVFGDKAKNAVGTEQVVGGEGAMSDEEMRAVWLRRVRTRPADFLRAKFSYQYRRREKP